jgi:hypothetical protein
MFTDEKNAPTESGDFGSSSAVTTDDNYLSSDNSHAQNVSLLQRRTSNSSDRVAVESTEAAERDGLTAPSTSDD